MPWWVPLAAAALAGLLTLGGVALGQHLNRQQKLDDRLEAGRLEQRDVLVDLIDVLDRWAPQAEIFAMVLAQEDTSSRESLRFLETDSGKEMQQNTKDLRRVLVRCLLTVVDEELRPLVVQVDAAVRGREDMHKDVLRQKSLDSVKAVGVGMAYAARLQRANAQLQAAAVRRLSTPPASPARRWWQRARKP